jgi:hypothetical protein
MIANVMNVRKFSELTWVFILGWASSIIIKPQSQIAKQIAYNDCTPEPADKNTTEMGNLQPQI